jgi:glutamate/tyrosine decarboxylase-like PLP-dependent enzyme
VLYLSDQTHSSITRALRFLGFTREQLRTLPADESFRLRLDALRRAVRKDRMGDYQPFCVIANAGTTNTGAIDPLPELAEFCRRENLWLHVDGAYGAAAVFSERGRELLRGLELVDSLALDPHKWLFQPYEMGCVLVRDAQLMRQTYQITAAYLEDTKAAADEINFCDESMQLTREFRALKLWLSLKYFGAAAFRQAIERGLELAEFTESILRESPDWEVLSPATLGIVAFRYVRAGASQAELNTLNQRLVSACTEDGFAFVSSTLLKGRTALRMCTINPRTTDEDICASIARLTQLGHALPVEEVRHERSARQSGAS